ncbi:MAG: hypothetical protein F6J95_000250 [Leptolyngbya sp. SIO1E4]|nr:hypothetical protein [Leptolyngbya sp. SIO1E4]
MAAPVTAASALQLKTAAIAPRPIAPPEAPFAPQWSRSPTQTTAPLGGKTPAKVPALTPSVSAPLADAALTAGESGLSPRHPVSEPATTPLAASAIAPDLSPSLSARPPAPIAEVAAAKPRNPKGAIAPTSPQNLTAPALAITAPGVFPDVERAPSPESSLTPDVLAPDGQELAEETDPVPDADSVELEADPDIRDEDLGEIRILRPQATPPPPQPPIAQLLLQASAFASTNITGLEAPSEGGYPLGSGATLLLTPPLGPGTRLIASAGGGLTRFPGNGSANYNALDFSAGIQHQLNRETYGRIGWNHRQLHRAGDDDQLSSTHAVNLTLGRQDWLSDRLRLDSFYRLQAHFVNPDDFSRLTHTLGTNLRYTLSPQVESLVGYQLALEDYTQTVRFDTKHRLRAGITYRPSRDLYVSGLVSYLLGASSESDVALDGLTVGLTVGFNLPLF